MRLGRRHSALYRAHLRSPEWRAIRKEALERAGYRCAFCGRAKAPGRPLQVHHNTYVNLGHERPEDLTVLCAGRGGCHAVADRQRRSHVRGRKRGRGSRRRRRSAFRGLRLPLVFLFVAGGLKVVALVLPTMP